MAQFAYDQQGAQYGQQGQPSVQWYQSAGEAYNTSYTYDTAGTSAAYGSFEEEAPLLEGNTSVKKQRQTRGAVSI